MLKIRDDVDFTKLEKYGFEKRIFDYAKEFYYEDCTVTVTIDSSRYINIQNDYYDTEFTSYMPNVIFDLIQDGLVEKVSDSNGN